MNIDGTTGLGRSAFLGQGQPGIVQKRQKLAIEYDESHFVTCC